MDQIFKWQASHFYLATMDFIRFNVDKNKKLLGVCLSEVQHDQASHNQYFKLKPIALNGNLQDSKLRGSLSHQSAKPESAQAATVERSIV